MRLKAVWFDHDSIYVVKGHKEVKEIEKKEILFQQKTHVLTHKFCFERDHNIHRFFEWVSTLKIHRDKI